MSHTNTWIAKHKLQHKRALIYALGGGSGHTQRATLIASYFSNPTLMLAKPPKNHGSYSWVCPKEQPLAHWVHTFIKKSNTQYDVLIVDTFPEGILHELSQTLIQLFPMQILIARYLREEAYPNYEASRAWYTHALLPYESENCEWDSPQNGTYIGTLTRSIHIDTTKHYPLVVIGDLSLLPKGWRALIPTNSLFVDYYFETLPKANGYVCIGAGYNLFWEMMNLGCNTLHYALHKRYDDQFRRAGIHSRLGTTAAELQDFVHHCVHCESDHTKI